VKITDASDSLTRIFIDTAPIIYHVENNPRYAPLVGFIYNLTLPDALQVAAALQAQCDGFLTNDSALGRVTELRVLLLNDLEL
jgi:predicted nucleic acid-binding protein